MTTGIILQLPHHPVKSPSSLRGSGGYSYHESIAWWLLAALVFSLVVVAVHHWLTKDKR